MNRKSHHLTSLCLVLFLSIALGKNAIAQTTQTDPQSDNLTVVTVGGGGHRMASFDGTTFKHHQQWGPCGHDKNDLLNVAYGNGVFVGVGGWSRPRVVFTAEGIHWREADPEQFSDARGGSFCVQHVDDSFYMMSQMGDFMKSADGERWTRAGKVPLGRQPQQRIRDLAFGRGTFVGVGDYGTIAVSTDMGQTWTIHQAKHHGTERTWPAIEFGSGKFVMAGLGGYTATSTDGSTWQNETLHDGVYKKVDHLHFAGDAFFAIGNRVTKGPPDMLYSPDGIQWERRKFSWTNSPKDVYHFAGTYFGVRDDFWKGNAKLYVSSDGIDWQPIANPKGFSVRAMAGRR